jgi:serpin B
MPSAFGSEADFSGMTTDRRLAISAVVHKAFADVNEEGTEAAAATAVAMLRMSVRVPNKPPVVFRADHPFLFLIRDVRSGSILFMGRVANPKG